MKKQRFELKNEEIRRQFAALRKSNPNLGKSRLNVSWSNWGFGIEPLATSARRLAALGVKFIELHGNQYGADLGYRPVETKTILADHGIDCAGICGMFSRDNDLSSNSGVCRQNAVEYLKRSIDFAAELKAEYVLVVPGAVGRPGKYDDAEFDRSVATLRLVADRFAKAGIKAAIEPIRAAEVSFCHTIADAQKFIAAVDHPAISHINADLYHMQVGETHIGQALLAAGKALVNLHVADSNRCALGEGSLDLDTVIRSLYLLGFNRPGRYFTPEPLGPGGDPYPAMNGRPDPAQLDALVRQTVNYFREREDAVLGEDF
jgi:D-psicose/D-tagatose/L-ribulose 3-epimerase